MRSEGGPPGPPSVASRPAGVAIVVLAALLTLAGCASRDPDPGGDQAEVSDLEAATRRAVVVETGACGSADPTRGSGLAIDDELVLTAAHVVASGGAIEVVGADGPRSADLVAYDPQRDLALVAPNPSLTDIPPAPTSGALAEGASATIVSAGTSGDVPATVLEVLVIETDDVRSPSRSTRRAYLVEAITAPGDSGAGVYDDGGRLAGLLFAVSTTDDRRSWVTAASEIDAFLADEAVRGDFVCDQDRSRVARAR